MVLISSTGTGTVNVKSVFTCVVTSASTTGTFVTMVPAVIGGVTGVLGHIPVAAFVIDQPTMIPPYLNCGAFTKYTNQADNA